MDTETTGACLEKVKRYLGVWIEGFNHKQGGPRISKSFFSLEESKSKILRGYCGVIEPEIIPPSFVLGLRPMSRPIITCKKDNGDRGNLKVMPRTSLSLASLDRGRRRVIYQ